MTQSELMEALKSLGVKLPKAAVVVDNADKNARFAKKDAKLRRAFARKGIKDVTLIDRNDPSKTFDVKPFKAWVAEGRMVRKGEHGVRGLFHISQTSEIAKVQ